MESAAEVRNRGQRGMRDEGGGRMERRENATERRTPNRRRLINGVFGPAKRPSDGYGDFERRLSILTTAYANKYGERDDVNHTLRSIVLKPSALGTAISGTLTSLAKANLKCLTDAQLSAIGEALAPLVLYEAFGHTIEYLVRSTPELGASVAPASEDDAFLEAAMAMPHILITDWTDILVGAALGRLSGAPVAQTCDHMQNVLHLHMMIAPNNFRAHMPLRSDGAHTDFSFFTENELRRSDELSAQRVSMAEHIILFMKIAHTTPQREIIAIFNRLAHFNQSISARTRRGILSQHLTPNTVYIESHENCAICMDHMPREDVLIFAKGAHCSHIYCCGCLTRFMRTRNACPICRQKLDYGEQVRVIVKSKNEDECDDSDIKKRAEEETHVDANCN